MEHDLIFYQFSRSKVERGDFSHFLSLYAVSYTHLDVYKRQKQTTHFTAQIRIIGAKKSKTIEIEHHPHDDFPKTHIVSRSIGCQGQVCCEVKMWSVYGEFTAFEFRAKAPPKTARNQLLAITVDETGLTISGTDLQQTSSN